MLNISLLYVLPFIAFVGMFSLNSVATAFKRIQKKETKKQQKTLASSFFYRKFHHFAFKDDSFEGTFFATLVSQNFLRLATALFFGIALTTIVIGMSLSGELISLGWLTLSIILMILGIFTLGEFIPRLVGSRYPEGTIKLLGWLASCYALIAFPFFFPFFKIWQTTSRTLYPEQQEKGHIGQQEIIDMIEDNDDTSSLEPQEKKIFESVVSFRDRIAREVMVPRVDTFFLPAHTSIKEAALNLQKEGYSRVPVYKNTVDEILGILLWRDLLFKYVEYDKSHDEKILEAPIETILRIPLYTPETKKISRLLQELRKKQMHLAIVVDEYGGTQGIVSIEDILEEIVGEIEDEYDEEPPLFKQLSDESWLVDARMSIYDIEEQLDIEIPQEGDYDTLGGYLFHVTGMIPPKGFTIRHDDFTLKVVSSTDRQVSKVELKKNHQPAD